MLIITRFAVAPDQESDRRESDREETFPLRARSALAALAGQPGYLRGRLARSVDEPATWCLLTEWESVGAYRRALGGYEVKVAAVPLLAESLDEPSAFEVLASADPAGPVVVTPSDLAARTSR